MLMVVFGAGASYDSAQAFPLPRLKSVQKGLMHTNVMSPDPGGPWRPPVANDLFRDPNQTFGHIVQRYPKLTHILPFLRQPSNGRTVEEELESLQAHGGAERTRELASVTYYLRDLLFEVSNQWRDRTSGVTNYAPLIGEILQLDKSGEPVCLVTFNYDLLLDRGLITFGYDPQDLEVDYFSHPRLKLFKPHGSVNWARFVDMHPDTRLLPQHLADRAEAIRLTDEFVMVHGIDDNFPRGRTVFPVIAIPFQNKTQDTFVWPPSHRTQLLGLFPSVRKILIIGWQAKEAHFLELLRSNLGGVTHLMVVGRDTADSQEILQRVGSEIARTLHPNCTYYTGRGGFTRFVLDHEGDAFLEA